MYEEICRTLAEPAADIRFLPARSRDGEVAAIVGIARDITARALPNLAGKKRGWAGENHLVFRILSQVFKIKIKCKHKIPKKGIRML